jgi:TonB family protein
MFLFTAILFSTVNAQDAAKTQTANSDKHSSQPSCIDCPDPEYPAAARKAKIAPTPVVLEVLVTEKGEVRDARVVRAPNKEFADNALKAVKKWKLKPAIGPNGKPVAVKATLEVLFHVL